MCTEFIVDVAQGACASRVDLHFKSKNTNWQSAEAMNRAKCINLVTLSAPVAMFLFIYFLNFTINIRILKI